jgi:hypothetical protein
MRERWSGFDVWDRLWKVLHDGDRESVVYAYRINAQGEVTKPYLVKCVAWPGLLKMLRDEFGGGDFLLLIKSGRTMKFSGRIAVVETATARR